MRSYNPLLLLMLFFAFLSSCQKEINDSTIGGTPGGNTGGPGGGNNNNTNCNSTVMKLKRWQALFDDSDYVAATWNATGGIQSLRYNKPLSEYRTAVYVYQNSRISQAILFDDNNIQPYDTAMYRYNAAGLVDSMYLKNHSNFDFGIKYNNGKITRITSYGAGLVLYYWDVETDANGNIVKATEWSGDNNSFKKESVYTYTRDDKKNPLKDVAVYMFYHDDEYSIFRDWGPNNYTSQRYQDFSGLGIDILTGFKFKYNENCYPSTSQQTLAGQVLFPDDDFRYTYY